MAHDFAPDYDRLDGLLAGIELAPSAAEAQAILCGLLAVRGADPVGCWVDQLLPPQSTEASGEPSADLREPSPARVIDLTFDGRAAELDASPAGDAPLHGSDCDHAHGSAHASACDRGVAEHAHDHAHAHAHCDHPHHHGGPESDSGSVDPDALRSALSELARWTTDAIAPPSVSFDLLLPPEERPLRERATAVYDWVRGMLFGLTLGGLEREQLDAEAREAFDDLVELTRLDLSAIEGGEEDEQALAEIIEFLRVAAMTIREGVLRPSAGPMTPGSIPGPDTPGPDTPGPKTTVH